MAPLDLMTDAFYVSRKELIDKRLEEIRTQQLHQLFQEAMKNEGISLLSPTSITHRCVSIYDTHTHTGIQCVGVNWDKYKLENLQDIALCVGGRVLANIFGLFAEDYKGWGSGMPDLLLWKPQGKKIVIVMSRLCDCVLQTLEH